MKKGCIGQIYIKILNEKLKEISQNYFEKSLYIILL